MSRSRSDTQAGFSSATVITTRPSTSSSRSSSPTAVGTSATTCSRWASTCWPPCCCRCFVGRRALSRWTYHSEARSMTPAIRVGQRRLSSRWNRRGASSRAASRSFNAAHSKPDGRTVCPSSPAASSHGACPRRRATARHSSTTTAVSSSVRSCASSTTTRSKSANPAGSSSSRSRATAAAAAASSGKMRAKASGSRCPATFSSALAAARPTPRSSARRSRYAASLSRTSSPVAIVSASPGTA